MQNINNQLVTSIHIRVHSCVFREFL